MMMAAAIVSRYWENVESGKSIIWIGFGRLGFRWVFDRYLRFDESMELIRK